MNCRVAIEAVDQADAVALIEELDSHLESLYPPQNRHGLLRSVADGKRPFRDGP